MSADADQVGRSRLTVATVIVGGLAGLFPSLVLVTSLPDIAADLGTDVESLRWALTAPLLASAVCLPVAGKLSDVFGHRRVFALGLLAVLVGSVAIAQSWNGPSFIIFRTLTQVAGIAIQPAGLSMLNAGVRPEDRAKAFSWWALVVAAGPALGLGLGGPLADATNWTSVFYVEAVLAVAAVVMVRALPRGPRPARSGEPFDAAGAVLLGLSALGVVVMIDQGISLGIDHVVVRSAAASTIVVGALFWITERRAASPVVPARLVADRTFTAAVAAQFFTQATSMGTVTVTPLLMRGHLGLSTSEASFLLMVMPVSFAVAAPLGGRVASHNGHRRSALIGTALLVSGGLLLTAAAATTSLPLVVVGLAGIGGGGGICKPGYSLAVAGSGGGRDVGIAVATERMFTQIGSTLGVATLLSVVAAGSQGGFVLAAFLAAAFSAAALVVALVFVGKGTPVDPTVPVPAPVSVDGLGASLAPSSVGPSSMTVDGVRNHAYRGPSERLLSRVSSTHRRGIVSDRAELVTASPPDHGTTASDPGDPPSPVSPSTRSVPAATTGTTAVKVAARNVRRDFLIGGGQSLEALGPIDFDIHDGEFACLVGPSGCGKSTFLRSVAGLVPPSDGEIRVEIGDPTRVPIAMVFQDYGIYPWKSVEQNVRFGLQVSGVKRKDATERARFWLDRMGLADFANSYPDKLSGGMRQRVAIARAFALEPELLLMDEPFAALDAQLREVLQDELLKIWQADRRTVLFVTHSLEEAIVLGDRVVVMSARPGRILRAVDVPFERPRTGAMRSTPEFAALKADLWDLLRGEIEPSGERHD